MLKINCDICDEEVVVNMYMSQPTIKSNCDVFNDRITWTARAQGRAICPNCGAEIVKQFASDIYPSDVIALALRGERHV